jgi:hypothetical protein
MCRVCSHIFYIILLINDTYIDWLRQKDCYQEWLYAGYCPALTKIPLEVWNILPSDTNIVETAHAGLTQYLGSGWELVDAVNKYVFHFYHMFHIL